MSKQGHQSNLSVEQIFLSALEIQSGPERTAYVDETCGHLPEIRGKIDRLLESYRDDDFLERSAIKVDPKEDYLTGITEKPGAMIGPYKILEQIGEGGFGTVFMAQQEEPIRRKVALKIIKAGMDTKQVIARFEAERQALALMDHPNIAKVLDAGTTETGRPYFVMELVEGLPITRFCEKQKLTIKERLNLFILVCQAIQHAHQKGIIHRDVKPTNVLVTLNEGIPHPLVIDFGVAKAIDQRLTEKTFFTNLAHMIGTPAYMSPEQAEMSKRDVDTRSDVYSLGILLYELLTGTTPFPEERLREVGYAELQRIISDEEPERPSTVLSKLNGRFKTVAANRKCEPTTLLRMIKGDLDWIILKAIDKDRNRRYSTVVELAADIQRHLSNEPVTAAALGAPYKIKKYILRNRVAVTIIMLILLGAGLSGWQAIRATHSRQQALIAHANAEATLQFLMEELISQVDPTYNSLQRTPDRNLTPHILAINFRQKKEVELINSQAPRPATEWRSDRV